MTDKIIAFTDLIVWQEGHKLVLMIYKASKKFPKDEIYSLIDQMRRCAISITSNIAEGFGRQTYKEKVQFYYLALGSLTELKNQLLIAKDVQYLIASDFDTISFQMDTVHKLLNAFIKKTKSFIPNSKIQIQNLKSKI